MATMNFFAGIRYNLQGLWMGLRTPALLLLGMVRLLVTAILTLALVAVVVANHGETLNLIWARPDGGWLLFLWEPLAYLLSLLLVGLAAVLAYLLAQILFAVFIMDTMSRLTERIVTGNVEHAGEETPFFRQLGFLVKQELPRAILPIVITLILVALGWMTPFGPILTLISPWVAALFLAWDNTDLVPARRLEPFSRRWRSLLATLPFHLGFGALFLLPLANLLFLSFAPVGGALYQIDKAGYDGRPPGKGG